MADLSPPQSRSALLAHGLLLGGAGAAIFLAGGAPQGNLGVFLLAAGVALVVCPPRVRVPWRLWWAAGGLVFCGGLAFLPARFLPVPLWRRALAGAPAVTLPGTITAAPAETAFWLLLLALSLVIGLFALSQPVRARGMVSLVLAAVLGCAVYAGLATYAKLSGWHYPFSGGATFGFLPNRNHTATLLITGSILAVGLMSVAFRDRRWLVADAAVAGGLACVVALCFFSESRAGVLILPVGGALWLAGLGRRHRPGRLLVAVAVVAVTAGGGFLAVKSPARDRLLETVGIHGKDDAKPTPGLAVVPSAGGSAVAAPSAGRAAADPPSEFRLSIYRDTWAMIRDQPWTGSGLGTFAGVFPQYRRASVVAFNALHPESDWLMLIAEAGWPAFACCVALVAMAAGQLAGWREHPYWPLRWGCAAAAAAALLHGAVDVPAHRAALGWWVLALAGLALQRREAKTDAQTDAQTDAKNGCEEGMRRQVREAERMAKVQRAGFVLAGVGALVLGGQLVRAEWFHGPALPPFVANEAPQRLFDAYQHQEYAAGTALARRIVREAPLTPSAYYYLGIFLAVSDEEGVDQQVDEVFQAERLLDPVLPDVPQRQAMAWAGYDPARQTAMLMVELARLARINRATGGGVKEELFYRDLVNGAARQPDVQRFLLAVVRPDPQFETVWARQAEPGMAQSRVDRLAADDAWVAGASRGAIHREGGGGVLQPDWHVRPESDGPSLPATVGSQSGEGATEESVAPEWLNSAWPVRLRQCVYAGKYAQAVEMVTRRYGISLALPGAAGDGAVEHEGGAAGAFVAAWGAGDQAGARRGLAAVNVDTGEPAALEVWRWRAALAAHDGNWTEAWLGLERYVRHTRQTEWP